MCPVSDEWANLTFLHLKIFRFFNVSWILFKDRPTLRKTGLPRQIDKSDSYAIYPLLPKWEFVRF